MDGSAIVSDDPLDPPLRLFERLRQIAGYTWDESRPLTHSTYDNWQTWGTRFVSPFSVPTSNPISPSSNHVPSTASLSRIASSSTSSNKTSPIPDISSILPATQSEPSSDFSATSPPPAALSTADSQLIEEPVVARISTHVLREERAFHIAKGLVATADPNGKHIAKPIDLIRLTPISGDRGPLVVAIYQAPGENYIPRALDLGPAYYTAKFNGEKWEANRKERFQLDPPISLQHFLDFAIGATQCLEMIHHDSGVVHGEIRPDAFHFEIETDTVKLITVGSGLRSFEHGLTSTGWSALSKELGAKNKLIYISPEQTGRMPAEPDTRTDIYSLGIVFLTLLTQQPVFDGDSPLDIVQGVLGRRIPNVSTIRMDIPDVIGRIIQKCTSKNVNERYNSASGLRHDLLKVQQFLGDGDWLALKEWQIGTNDVSSFFMLPAIMIGRNKERADLVKVIERVAKSHAISRRGAVNRFSDGSSLSNELLDAADGSSEGAGSSVEGVSTNRRSGSFTQTISSDPKARSVLNPFGDLATIGGDTTSGGSNQSSRHSRPWERHQSVSFETKSLGETLSGSGDRDSARYSGPVDHASSSLSRQLGSAKFRRRGHCEIVIIEGTGGLGKSCLVQSILTEARRKGYCATAKFDTARRTAFGPLLKLLSSLFRQVWGERNTETPFHQALKQYVRPVWPMLHKVLGLPEFLLGSVESPVVRSLSTTQGHRDSRSVRSSMKRRGSSPDGSPGSSLKRMSKMSSQSSQDYLRQGATTKTIRLMNTFLDVLRMFTHQKFICFCVEDLHFADDESLELITQILGARMKMVVVMTYRPEEFSAEQVQKLINPPESDEFSRVGAPAVTKITLSPLPEDDIIQYVSTTLCRPKEEILPLALVIQSKTGGNPFYMREMLKTCHRKKCIWYEYKDNQWHYDLDKVFEQFQGEQNYDLLDTAFITRRLNELPPVSRSILSWGALLGQTFSFDLISKLMSGEFAYPEDTCLDPSNPEPDHFHTSYTQEEAVAGLQAAIQAYIIVPSERDDRFRFAHDRYIQAASELKECNSRKMHFAIARTLMKYYPHDVKALENTASHICESVDIIKRRVQHRQPFRKLLFDCAQAATENGARPTAAKFYSNAIALLQPHPWDDNAEDVSYNETVQLYLRSAECYLYMGHQGPSNVLLGAVLRSAKPEDTPPAIVLQSRIFAQSGDSIRALQTLKQCLRSLGIQFDENPTFETLDAEFERLSVKIQAMNRNELLNPTAAEDPNLASIGAVMAEAVGAGFWSDNVSFYQMALLMLDTHLTHGAFPQSGMAFLHTAMVALSRFNRVRLAIDLGSTCLELLDRFRDPFSMGRGYMLFANFIAHVQLPISVAANQMDSASDYAASAGDRILTILGFGLTAQLKFFASENCGDLEAYCQWACEEIPNWHLDTRGGTLLVAVRQACRALMGKTRTSNPLDVMSDDQHNSVAYKTWLKVNTNNGSRSRLFYDTMEMAALFLYGHYDRAIEVGKTCIDEEQLIWSSRTTRFAMLLYGLSLGGVVLREQQDPRSFTVDDDHKLKVEETIKQIEELNKKIKVWEVVTNINYLAWSRLLDARMSELRGEDGTAIQQYEEALDHAAEHNFVFEEALGNYLMAGVFIRHSARRSARSALRDAVALYRQFGATGIAERIESEHSILLLGQIRNLRTAEIGVQTDFAADSAAVQYRAEGEEGDEARHVTHAGLAEIKGERLGQWRGSMQPEAGAGLPALDMIDLHAILVSSQVISSLLQVDELLKTMCDVILQTCGGSATMAAIVVQDEDTHGWCVAASGDPEKGAATQNPRIPLKQSHLVAENVILYSTRFREVVFVRDLVADERFGNVSESWLQRNPFSKAVIAIPICHGNKPLLGVLYLEGVPGSFTDRNVTVLQLLVNQIGISYSNALAMKAVEKVSAENVSMVELQKRALAKAIEAETEARNSAKLAEEAAKAKSIFLANVSHELRTPLNGVIGNSELLKDSNLNKDQLEMADSIRVSADLLLTVINDILDLSRLDAHRMELYIIAFNPQEMVREVVRAVSYSNREKPSKKNVKIVQDINLPPMLIYGDPIRLHQVLGNLIANSLKFTENGTITIGARVDSDSKEKAKLTFWVKDTGIGISEQQLVKLFQPFSQADASTARKYGGSGLGLSICKSLIETMMKGKIRLESQEGVGTTAWFSVSFEKARPDAAAGEAQTAAPSKLPEPNSRSASSMVGPLEQRQPSPNPYLDLTRIPKDQLRICIAEDNAINAKIAIQYMQRLGYGKIDAYDNGLKAVEGLRVKANEGTPYHIILMDVQMPVLDGYEATRLLRKDPIEVVRKILVIAMTASAIQGDREKCLAAGMNDYLAKPVRSDVLKKKLDLYISNASPDRTPPLDIPTLNPFRPPPTPARNNDTLDLNSFRPSMPMRSSDGNASGLNGVVLPTPNFNLNAVPIRDNPAYSIPDGPPAAPSRASSDRSIDSVSVGGASLSGETTQSTAPTSGSKRQPRKLTKSRNSDVGLEKAKSVLQKKPPAARQSSITESEVIIGGGENIPLGGTPSGSKERLNTE